MRLMLELIVFGVLATLALSFFGDKQNLNEELKNSQDSIAKYEDRVDSLEGSVKKKQKQIDSVKTRVEEKEAKIVDLQKQLEVDRKDYEEKIKGIEEAKISELIDSTHKIVEINDRLYIAVPEDYYRQVKKNEVELERLKSKAVILGRQLSRKDDIIDLKDSEIMYLGEQLNNKAQQLHFKDSIISEKDSQHDLLKTKIQKVKLQRNLSIIGGAGIILLILL